MRNTDGGFGAPCMRLEDVLLA